MKRKINKVFVLGGSGFIGKHLLEELNKDDLDIKCLVNQSPLSIESSKIQLIRSSLTQFDWKSLGSNVPDVIIHTARLSGRDKRERKEVACYNAVANQRMLDWLSALVSPPLLIFVSGTLVYGSKGDHKANENSHLNPISFQREYFEAEKPILEALRKRSIPVMIVRPCWVYGPGSWLQAFYLDTLEKKNKIPQYGYGNNYMPIVHVRDCAGMIKYLAYQGEAGNIYNLFSQNTLTQKEFISILAKLTQKEIGKKSLMGLKIRYGHAVYEAFASSLKLETIHPDIFTDYTYYYPGIEDGLKDILN